MDKSVTKKETYALQFHKFFHFLYMVRLSLWTPYAFCDWCVFLYIVFVPVLSSTSHISVIEPGGQNLLNIQCRILCL